MVDQEFGRSENGRVKAKKLENLCSGSGQKAYRSLFLTSGCSMKGHLCLNFRTFEHKLNLSLWNPEGL